LLSLYNGFQYHDLIALFIENNIEKKYSCRKLPKFTKYFVKRIFFITI